MAASHDERQATIEQLLCDADRERRLSVSRVITIGAGTVGVLLGVFSLVQRNWIGACIAFSVGTTLMLTGASSSKRFGELFAIMVVACAPLVNLAVVALELPIASNPYWLTTTLVACTVLLTDRWSVVMAFAVMGILCLEMVAQFLHPSPPLPAAEALATATAIAATTGAMAWAMAASARKSLRRAIERELVARDVDERRRLAEEKYRLIADHTSDLVAVFDLDGHTLYVSPSHERVLDRTSSDRSPETASSGLLGCTPDETARVLRLTKETGVLRREVVLCRGSESLIVDVALTRVETPEGSRFVASGRDVTEERLLASRLQQNQKMEAVGRLAGGIAHDFNNLLSLIGAAATLALDQLPGNHPAVREVSDVLKGVERGNTLTSKLLAISRKQMPLAEQPARVRSSLESLGQLLKRVLPSNIRLVIEAVETSERVTASESDLEQILLNLSLNARDAMPEGGRLVIGAESRRLSRGIVALPAGRYMAISVSDTGTGMNAEVRRHLFEPFFTTKPPGKGTGLGLATSFGIATQHGGTLLVESTEGRGTTFTLWLPVASADSVRNWQAATPAVQHVRDNLAVLLIEDDPLVLASTTRILTSLGHRVKGAASATQAIQLHDDGYNPDVLVADLMLTDGLSYGAVDHIVARQPDIRVVFVSGYAEDPARLAQYLKRGARLLPKPFTRQAMIDVLSERPFAPAAISPQPGEMTSS